MRHLLPSTRVRRTPHPALLALAAAIALSACEADNTDGTAPATCDAEDPYAPNSSQVQAAPLPLDQLTAEGGATLPAHLCTGDTDWFFLEAAAGQVLDVALEFTQVAGDLQLDLVAQDGTVIATAASITDNEYLRHTFTRSGTFYLRISPAYPTFGNAYLLKAALEGSACEVDALEPNDSVEPAPLASGLSEGLSVCFGDEDWYTIEAGDGQVVSVAASFDAAQADLEMALYTRAPDGTLAFLEGSQPNAAGANLVERVSGGGPFLLQVLRGPDTRDATYDLDLLVSGEACEADASEPNDGYLAAFPITPGIELADHTLCVGDQDWFEISVGDSQLLNAELRFAHDDGDLSLQLYERNDDGTISRRVGSNTLTDDETINYRPFNGGEFLMQIFPSRGSATGHYDFVANLVGEECLDDGYEPNNAYTEATELGIGSYADMTLCVGDDDWFELPDVASGQLITSSIGFIHEANDLALAIYKRNADGTISYRAGSNTLTDDETVIYRPFDDGTFLARVYRTRGTQVATYTMDLAIDGKECVADAQEPNNAYPEAADITPGSFEGQTLCVGDADWYAFEASNGQLVDVDVSFDHDINDIGVTLYKENSDGTISGRTGSNTLTDNESITYRPYDDGTFLLSVYRTRGTQLADYDMDVAVTGDKCTEDNEEPNNSYTEAAPLTSLGDQGSKTLCVGDADWYEFSADNGQLIEADIEFTHADNDLGMNIYKLNSDGTISNRVGSNTLTDDESIRYRPFDSGTFLAYVYRTRGTQLADYDFSLDVTGKSCTKDAEEPNDAASQATTIADADLGDQGSKTLCVGDADWFEFEAKNGQLIDIEADFTHSLNDIGIALYYKRADGTLVSRAGANSLTDDETIKFRPYEDGTFVLYVYRTRGTAVAEYDLFVDVSGNACTADTEEPNDTYTQRASVTLGDADSDGYDDVSLQGKTLCVGDTDWYEFPLVNGELFDATLSFTHAQNDLGFRLYRVNSDGTISSRAGADTLTDNEFLLYRPYDSGDFALQVYRSRGTQTAEYDLDVEIAGTACTDDSYEPNNHWLQTTTINTTGTTVTGLTSCVGDDDWFDLGKPSTGDVISASAFFTHADNDFGAALYRVNSDKTLSTLTSADTLTDDEYLVYTVPSTSAGRQVVYRVYRSRGTPVGEYDVEIDIQ